MRSTLAFIIILCIAWGSCKKAPIPETAQKGNMELYFYDGFSGNLTAYLITDKQLLQDTMRLHPDDKYTFDYALPDSKFQQVKDLWQSIPARLFSENNTTYGSNKNVYDAGAVNIVYHTNELTYKWTFEFNAPKYVGPLLEKLSNAREQIEK